MAITTNPIFKGPIGQLVVQLNRLWLEMATALNLVIAIGPGVPSGRTITAGDGLTGGGDLSANRIIDMGTPSSVTLASTNSTTASSHTHAFAPGGTTAQYIRGDGTLATTPAGSVTSVSAGNGMNFATITTTGAVTLGTPSSLTPATANAVTAVSHTHAITGFMPLAGGSFSGGIDFGSATVASVTDLSRHIALFGTTIGFSVTANNLNYVAPTGVNHSWYTNAVLTMRLDSAGNLDVPTGTVSDVRGDLRHVPVTVSNTSITLGTSHLNGLVEKSSAAAGVTYTIPLALGVHGDAITITNSNTNNLAVNRIAGVSLFRAGVNANLTLVPGSMVTIVRSATANVWLA